MNQTFSFAVTAMDTDALLAQVSRGLEQRSELLSRQKSPRLWSLIDRLRSVPKVSPQVSERRRRRRNLLALLCWLLSVVALIPALLEPRQMAAVLAVGLVCFVLSSFILWCSRRRVLGILSLVLGLLLFFCIFGGQGQLDPLLAPAGAAVVLGLAALALGGRRSRSSFDKAAAKLLEGRESAQGMEETRVIFSEAGLSLCQGDAEIFQAPYAEFESVIETEDLLLPIVGDRILVLQKKDLLEGRPDQLRLLLQQHSQYIPSLGDVPRENSREKETP